MNHAPASRPGWWGGRVHALFTVAVFVVLSSLDNAIITVLPPLYRVVAQDLGVSEAAVGLITAMTILVAAVTSVYWVYLADRGDRKRLLLCGTLVWGASALLVGVTDSYLQFFLAHTAIAVGAGCIASVGFSVVSDLVPPRRRGLAMSGWGLAQGIGGLVGALLAGMIGGKEWQTPFTVLGAVGVGFAFLYIFGYDPRRGQTEPELRQLYAEGGEYQFRLKAGDILGLARTRSNVWLVVQGLTAQITFGSLLWLPMLIVARMQSSGYSLPTAAAVGSVFMALFQVGGLLALLGGHIGDRWQSRNPRGRALLSAFGMLGAVPFYLALFFLPIGQLSVPDGGGALAVAAAAVGNLFSNGWVLVAFFAALAAVALTSVNSPNWLALISDVNLPEHRGTVFGMGNLVNGIGRAVGNGVMGAAFGAIALAFPEPLNYAVGLAVFQVFFLPTGLCYYLASRTTPADIRRVRRTLSERVRRTEKAPVVADL